MADGYYPGNPENDFPGSMLAFLETDVKTEVLNVRRYIDGDSDESLFDEPIEWVLVRYFLKRLEEILPPASDQLESDDPLQPFRAITGLLTFVLQIFPDPDSGQDEGSTTDATKRVILTKGYLTYVIDMARGLLDNAKRNPDAGWDTLGKAKELLQKMAVVRDGWDLFLASQ